MFWFHGASLLICYLSSRTVVESASISNKLDNNVLIDIYYDNKDNRKTIQLPEKTESLSKFKLAAAAESKDAQQPKFPGASSTIDTSGAKLRRLQSGVSAGTQTAEDSSRPVDVAQLLRNSILEPQNPQLNPSSAGTPFDKFYLPFFYRQRRSFELDLSCERQYRECLAKAEDNKSLKESVAWRCELLRSFCASRYVEGPDKMAKSKVA